MLSSFNSLFGSDWSSGLALGWLSSTVQRKVLAYLLKRSLGHLLDIPESSIEAAVSSGKLEIRDVEIKANAVNEILGPALAKVADVRCVSGRIDSLIVQLPMGDLLKGALQINLSKLDIDLSISPATEDPSSEDLSTRLADSIASLADRSFAAEDEAAKLEESLQQSLASVPESGDIQPTGIVATLVQSLLSRLSVQLTAITVTTHFSGGPGLPFSTRDSIVLEVLDVRLSKESDSSAKRQSIDGFSHADDLPASTRSMSFAEIRLSIVEDGSKTQSQELQVNESYSRSMSPQGVRLPFLFLESQPNEDFARRSACEFRVVRRHKTHSTETPQLTLEVDVEKILIDFDPSAVNRLSRVATSFVPAIVETPAAASISTAKEERPPINLSIAVNARHLQATFSGSAKSATDAEPVVVVLEAHDFALGVKDGLHATLAGLLLRHDQADIGDGVFLRVAPSSDEDTSHTVSLSTRSVGESSATELILPHISCRATAKLIVHLYTLSTALAGAVQLPVSRASVAAPSPSQSSLSMTCAKVSIEYADLVHANHLRRPSFGLFTVTLASATLTAGVTGATPSNAPRYTFVTSTQIKRPVTGPLTELKLQSISVSHCLAKDGAVSNDFLKIIGATSVSISESGHQDKQVMCRLPTLSIELARQEWCVLQILADQLAALQRQVATIAPRTARPTDMPTPEPGAMTFHLGIDTARLELILQDASTLSALVARVEISLVASQPVTVRVANIQVTAHGTSGPSGYLQVEAADQDKQSALVVQYFADGQRSGDVSPQIVVRLSSLGSSLDLSEALAIGTNLAAFLVAPDGIFEEVAPAERTTLSISADDAKVVLYDESCRESFELVCLSISCDVDLDSVAGRQQIRGRWGEILLSLQESAPDKRSTPKDRPPASSAAPLVEVRDGQASFLSETSPIKRQRCELARAETVIHLCADTMQVIDGFVKGIKAKTEQVELPAAGDEIETAAPAALASDLSASNAVQTLSPPLIPETLYTGSDDMLTDDVPARSEFLHRVPANPQDVLASFLEEGTTQERKAPHTFLARSSRKGISPRLGYYRVLRKAAKEPQFDPSFSFAILSLNLQIHLHKGYDGEKSRLFVREQARQTKKRLMKLKQLLAKGQVPDERVSDIAGDLMRSVHIKLPESSSDFEADDFMHIMEEQLGSVEIPTGPALSSRQSSTQSQPKTDALARSTEPAIIINLSDVGCRYAEFAEDADILSQISMSIHKARIMDMLATSTWQDFLSEMLPDNPFQPVDPDSRTLKMRLETHRSSAPGARAEKRLRLRVAPLRLHVDQDALDFLKAFFSFSGGQDADAEGGSTDQTFIQFAEVMPVRLKLDYKPKRVNYALIKAGKTIELMNFFHFDGAAMTLRHVELHGITGWARLGEALNDIWAPDVTSNQLSDVLSGIAPIRTVANVGAGVADLLLLPLEQYNKDGRIFKGVQRGASSFAKATALEAIKIGAKLATGTQVILENFEQALGSSAVGDDALLSSREVVSRYSAPPQDLRDALDQAYSGFSKGLSSAAQTILAVPMEIHERQPGQAHTTPVIRAVPIAFLQGAAGASEAVSKTLQGVQNLMQPNHSRDVQRKYKQ